MNNSYNDQKRLISPIFIIITAFLSTFMNAQIYLFGEKSSILLLTEYLFLLFVSFCLIWILVNIIKLKKIYKRTIYFLPLLLWVLCKTILLVLFAEGDFIDYVPRNLLACFFAMLVIVLGIKDNKTFTKVILAFGFGAMLSAIIPLILFPEIIGHRHTIVNGVYYEGGFWNYTLISFVSTSWLLIALISANNNKFIKFFSILTILITAIGSLSGLSRGFIIIASLSLFGYLLYLRKIKVLLYFCGFITLLIILFPILFPNVILGYQERFNDGASLFEDNARTNIWITYFEHIKEYYFVGTLGDYRDYHPRGAGPHSVFLNWFVQYGIIGLIGFFYLLFGFFNRVRTLKSHSRNQAAALFAWIIAYLALSSINQTGFIEFSIFVAYGILLSWPNNLYKENENSAFVK